MKVYAYFEKHNLPNLIQALKELGSCSALTIGESEKSNKADVSLGEHAKVENFINAHKEGFFLHSNSGLYDVSLQDNSFSTICFFSNETLDDDSIVSILSAYANANAEFGYAAEEEEYEYRNRIKVEVSGSEVEAWVGRNLSRYLSGFYYYTLISSNQINQKEIDSEAVKVNAISSLKINEHSIIYKFFESPDSWHSEKDRIDDICRASKNVFYKKDVETEAHKAKNVMEFIMKTREWN
jgi:hypothetical protein